MGAVNHNTTKAIVDRVSEIPRILSTLEAELHMLDKYLTELLSKINPSLRSAPDGVSKLAPVEPTGTDLGNTLQSRTDHVAALTLRVSNAVDRCEL